MHIFLKCIIWGGGVKINYNELEWCPKYISLPVPLGFSNWNCPYASCKVNSKLVFVLLDFLKVKFFASFAILKDLALFIDCA